MKTLRSILCALAVALLPVAAKAQCANGTVAQFNGTQMVCSATLTAVTITGAVAISLDNTAAAFNLGLVSTDAAMSANRNLIFNTQNGNRTINIAGDITLSGAITTSGSANLLTLTYSGTPTVAFGTGGTVVYTNVTTLSSLVSVGTITTGVWNATAITGAFGGTGLTTAAIGDIIYASATTPVWSRLAAVASGSALVSAGTNTAPAWSAAPSFGTSVTSPFFDATTAASSYRINGATILFVSGAYTQINSPATTSASLTFGNSTDSSMYISANVQIVFRTVAAVTYFAITPTSFQMVAIAVASLSTCNAGLEGARASVNNSNAASFTAGIGAVVAAGGTTHVPVYCDGTNWRIG